jgi:hypothetical protein
MVERVLADGSAAAWRDFRVGYLALLQKRFESDREPFDELAQSAKDGDVFLGCSCPSRANPDVARCHTVLALLFMKRRYHSLRVVFPKAVKGGVTRRGPQAVGGH